MPETADWEVRSVSQYVESQLHDNEDGVTLVQRVGQERIAGQSHRLYDARTKKGRWWVITEPTNLYNQDDYPDIDYALTFHIGIMVRMSQRRHVETDEETRPFAQGAWRRYVAAMEAMNTASDAEDYQAVGVKCREALLAIARENRDADWVGNVDVPPKADDLKGWMAIFAAALVPDRRQRAYLKEVSDKTWDIAVGLQHNTNATPLDADMVLTATEHVIANFILARLRFEQGAPARCGRCGSYRLEGDGVLTSVDGEEGYAAWTVCDACGWQSDRDFESFAAWRERVGLNLDRYLAGPDPDEPLMPKDGFSSVGAPASQGLDALLDRPSALKDSIADRLRIARIRLRSGVSRLLGGGDGPKNLLQDPERPRR